jgi:hypothetical protein
LLAREVLVMVTVVLVASAPSVAGTWLTTRHGNWWPFVAGHLLTLVLLVGILALWARQGQ